MTSTALRTVLVVSLALAGCDRGVAEPPETGSVDLTPKRTELIEPLTPMKLAQDPPGKVADHAGLQAATLVEGKGEVIHYGQIGRFHCIATLANGKPFWNTYETEPSVIRVLPPAVPLGLALGIEGMRVGERREITVPPEVGYGDDGEPMRGVPPRSLLQYEIELIEVVRGLEIEVTTPGTGEVLEYGRTGRFHYTGVLAEDGTVFDSSEGAEPRAFAVRDPGVIAGWALGLPGMKVHEKRRLRIPSELAYGERGTPARPARPARDGIPGSPGSPGIPANADLIFTVELVSISH